MNAPTRSASRPVTTTTGPALAVDLAGAAGVWTAHHGTVTGPSGDPETAPVRRGRIADADGCIALLAELAGRYPEPVPAGGVLVACRPVLTTEAGRATTRRVLDAVFAPARVVFIDAVRAAAIGSGAAAGTLLVADVGTGLTEVAVLGDGRVRAARRSELGTGDLSRGATVDLISDAVVRHLEDLGTDPGAPDLTAARARGLLLVGDGALLPGLAPAVSRALRMRVHRAAAPRTAALHGAGLAAMSLLRHPPVRAPRP